MAAGPQMFGRERETDVLLGALDEAIAGRGRLVLIEGEPGIGKSFLAANLADRARERPVDVLWGRSWEDAGAPPYWPWVQALRALLRSADDGTLRDDLGPGAADIVQLLPELAGRLTRVHPRSSFQSESDRFQLFDSATTFIRNAAHRRALLIVLEDLHAADAPSILLLRFVAAQMRDLSVMVAGTYRDLALVPESPLREALAELARDPSATLIHLGGLPEEAVAALLAGSADAAGPRAATELWRATRGNPLFVGEAIQLLRATGRVADPVDSAALRTALPAGIRSVIVRRLQQLDEPTLGVLGVCALLGPEFSLDIVRRAGRVDAADLRAQVDRASAAGVIVPVAGAVGRYRFAHELFRDTLDGELSPSARARIHHAIGETLEQVFRRSVEQHLPELAFHFVEALRADHEQAAGRGVKAAPRGQRAIATPDADREGLVRKAVGYARGAGDAAAGSLAYEEAVRHYRLALAALETLDASTDEVRGQILLPLAEALARAGEMDEARTAYLSVAELARRMVDGPLLAQAVLGFGGRYPWARPGRERRLVPLLQDALVLLGGTDDRLRVRLLTRLACAWRSSPERREDCDALSRQAVQLGRNLDEATLNYAVTGRYWATWWPENPDERVSLAAEAVRLAESLGDGERIIDAHLMVFQSLCERGRLAHAREQMEVLSRAIDELRQPAQLWIEPSNRALLALIFGDYPEAEKHLIREKAVGAVGTPGQDHLIAARMHEFLLRREQGRAHEAEAGIRASVADVPWYPFHRPALACLLLDGGREDEARLVFAALAADGFRALYRDNEWLLGMALASEACARLGDRDQARVLYELLAPFAGRHAIGHAEGSMGVVDRYLGLLAMVVDDLDAAAAHLEAAVIANDDMGALPWAAHSRHDLARALRQRGDPQDVDRAGEFDRAARELATRLEMRLAQEIGPDRVLTGLSATTAALPVSQATFRREGEYWSIRFGSATLMLRDSKGMAQLARLLGSPGQEIHALDLAREVDGEASGASGSVVAASLEGRADAFGDVGPALDAQAKAAYRMRLQDIREELAEAESWNDPERVVRLRAEERALTRELVSALGIGGRDRPTSSASERARVSVTRSIRSSLARIARQDPELGRHLEATIRTGSFCSYMPDPRAPIEWQTG